VKMKVYLNFSKINDFNSYFLGNKYLLKFLEEISVETFHEICIYCSVTIYLLFSK
jgi:hypothetical protein